MTDAGPSPEATISIPTAKPCKVCRGPILPGEAYVQPSPAHSPVHARHRPQRLKITPIPGPLRGGGFVPPPPEPMPMAIRLSDGECAHIDMLRQRSYELAVARGHIRR